MTLEIQYLAFLRGINVGGNNIIKMVELKACFESMGFADVRTYIQSGNVVFKSGEKDVQRLIKEIEEKLSEKFSYKSVVVVITGTQLQEVVADAPKGFGEKPEEYRYDVIFLKDHLTPQQAIQDARVREGVDMAYAGTSALYFSRLTSKATQSYMSKIVALPVYKFMTIRNWNTTTKLLSIINEG